MWRRICQNITVHAVSFDRQGGQAFYASLPGRCRNLQTVPGQRGRRQESSGLRPPGPRCGDGKSLSGKAGFPSIKRLSRFTWSTARSAGPISSWENIGSRPSPSARVAGESGPLFAGMSPISALMWQRPMNSRENIPCTEFFMTRSCSMH